MNAVWKFTAAGYLPKHLPDAYDGEVVLADLVDIPPEVQGVYWFAGSEWLFWAPGAPGCTLKKLFGGFDYMITVTGPCEWTIPLVEAKIAELTITAAKAKMNEPATIETSWKNISLDNVTAEVIVEVTHPAGDKLRFSTPETTLPPNTAKHQTINVTYPASGKWKLDGELKGE